MEKSARATERTSVCVSLYRVDLTLIHIHACVCVCEVMALIKLEDDNKKEIGIWLKENNNKIAYEKRGWIEKQNGLVYALMWIIDFQKG